MSQEDEDNVHEDDLSLSISGLPPEFHCGDSLTMDMVHIDYKGELDLDSCLPRYLLTTFLNNKLSYIEMMLLITWLYVHSVSLRRRETTCWSAVLHRHRHPSSPPSSPLSNQQYAMMQRRLGEVTSTSLCLTQMAPVQSTLFMCFLHYFRYYSMTLSSTYT